jgi:hypothetical protein
MITPPAGPRKFQPWQLEGDDGNMLDRSIIAAEKRERELEQAKAEIVDLAKKLALKDEAIALLRDVLAESEADLKAADRARLAHNAKMHDRVFNLKPAEVKDLANMLKLEGQDFPTLRLNAAQFLMQGC